MVIRMEKLYYRFHHLGDVNGKSGDEFIRLGLLPAANLEVIKSTMVIDEFPDIIYYYLCEKVEDKFKIKYYCQRCQVYKNGAWEEGLRYTSYDRFERNWAFALSELVLKK